MKSNLDFFSEEDTQVLRALYEKGFKRGDGQLDLLCKKLNRTKSGIAKKAKTMGLTDINRRLSQKRWEELDKCRRKNFAEYGHPKGMLGKHHSLEVCEKRSKDSKLWRKNLTKQQTSEMIIKTLQTKMKIYGTVSPTMKTETTWKQGWREIGGKKNYYRSRWEANYARYMQWKKERNEILEWEHEPQTFWFDKIKRGVVTYLPDFKITNLDGSHYWVEVKGYMDAKSKTKINRFKKYFPEEQLVVVTGKWYRKNNRKLGMIIKDWERGKA